MSLSKPSDENIFNKALRAYANLLSRRPILTKCATSAVTSGLGSLLSQILTAGTKKINWRSVVSFFLLGFCYMGPAMHLLHLNIDRLVPRHVSYAAIKRLLVERLLITPPLMFVYLILLNMLQEGNGGTAAYRKVREIFSTVLIMNWRFWTIFNYISMKYIPQEYRVLFGSSISLIWNIILAAKSK